MQAKNANYLLSDCWVISTSNHATLFSLSPVNSPVFVLFLDNLPIANSHK